MRFLRSVLCAAFFVSFGIGGLVFSAILALPLKPPLMRSMLRAQFRLFVFAAKVTGLFVVEATEEDRAALKSIRGSVIAANHISLIDIVILIAMLGDTVCVTKGAVGGNPFIRMIARKILIVNDGPIAVLEQAGGRLKEGVNVIVFPEGTRTPPDDPEHKFRRGAAQLAVRTCSPVETVFISADPPVLGKRQPWWDVGSRTIRYAVSRRGRIEPSVVAAGETVHEKAQALTARMKALIFGT